MIAISKFNNVIAVCALMMSPLIAQAQEVNAGSNAFSGGFGGAAGFDTSGQNAVHALEKAQQRADEHYKAERYERAYNMYRTLAGYGDKFSQYRVAFMHRHGRGVENDLQQAFAWSYVAAEAGDQAFVKYHRQIREPFYGEDCNERKNWPVNTFPITASMPRPPVRVA